MYGERIREKRKEFGLTRKELASRVMSTPQMIRLWEEEKMAPSIDDLVILAEDFNISVDWLLGLTDYEEEEEHSCETCDGFIECKLVPHMHQYTEENDDAGYVHIQVALDEDGEDALVYSGSTEAVLCAANLLLDSVASEIGMNYFDLVAMMASAHARADLGGAGE